MRNQQYHNFNIQLRILFLNVVLIFIFMHFSTVFSQKQHIVVIDAGHGGKDPGNQGNNYIEKNIALKVALIVGKQLEKQKDIKVIYTRENDVFIDLWKRGDIANHAKADLFVSIHCDSHTSSAYGAGTFVLGLRGNKKNLEIAKRENAVIFLEDNYKEKYKGFDSNSAESVIGLSLLQEENLDKSLAIASLIQNNFVQKLNRLDRKVKQDNFQVLRETIMPSVLIELGFLTNKKEGRYLNSKKGQQQMADAITAAIKKYIDNLKINTVIETLVTEGSNETSDVQYKVQIASSKTKLPTKPYNFKGLKNIERVQINSFYKYYYGNTSDVNQAKELLKEVQTKGYTSAFIVAYKNGEKISIYDATKLQ